jgi:hypothetical protein
LENKINSSIKDKLFKEKVDGISEEYDYKESSLKQVEKIVNNYNRWNKNTIDKRTRRLGKIALKIWDVK